MIQAALTSRDAPARAGDRIGRYEILSEVGRGGMGVVFRAHDLNLHRIVALKCPWPEHASDPIQRQRFVREARAASRLTHPAIVPLFDTFEELNLPWLVMEFVDGQSLRALLLENRKFSIENVLRLAEDMAGALQEAHDKGVIHRDVNPNNILITSDFRPLLTDFSLARFFQSKGLLTETASGQTSSEGFFLAGTPNYMAPEQLLGHPLDGRTDIFSLGLVLYEMVAGCPAFGSREMSELMDQILHHAPQTLSRLNYEMPPELERIILKCLAKDPEERYQSARELRADVVSLRHRLEVQHRPAAAYLSRKPTPICPLRHWKLVVSSIATLAAVGVSWLSLRHSAVAQLSAGQPLQLTSATGWEGNPAVSPDGREIAYAADGPNGRRIWIVDARGGPASCITAGPGRDSQPAWFPNGSDLAFVSTRSGRSAIWRVSRRGGPAIRLLDSATDPAISPSGEWLAFTRPVASPFQRICVTSLRDTTNMRVVTGNSDGVWDHRSPAWSPNGQYLVYAVQQNLWIVPAQGGKARLLTPDGNYDADPVWTPDGRSIYFTSFREKTQALWHIHPSGRDLQRLTTGTGHEREPSFDATGRVLAYSTSTTDVDIVLLDVEHGVETVLASDQVETFPTLAPDGSSLVFSSLRWGKYDLWRQPLKEGRAVGEPERITDYPGNASFPSYSPDGRWLAFYRIERGQRDICILPAGGGLPVPVTSDSAADYHPAWSPDGKQLAFVSERTGRPQVWVVDVSGGRPSGEPRRLTDTRMSVQNPAFSPDGRTMSFVDMSREVWVMDAATGSGLRALTRGAGACRARWLPDGSGLLVSGMWGGDSTVLKKVLFPDGNDTGVFPQVRFGDGESETRADFDFDQNLRTLAYVRSRAVGDIWLLVSNSRRLQH